MVYIFDEEHLHQSELAHKGKTSFTSLYLAPVSLGASGHFLMTSNADIASSRVGGIPPDDS